MRKNKRDSSIVIFAIIITNILIYAYMVSLNNGVLTFPTELLIAMGGDAPHLTTQGQWWRIFSSSFLHLDLMHLLSNMMGIIYILGYLKHFFSKSEMFIVYFASVFLGGYFSLLYNASYSVGVGASGGVFGLYGAFLVWVICNGYWSKINSRILVMSGQLIFFNMGFGEAGINAYAHLGGAVGGAGICLLVLLLEGSMNHLEKSKLIVGSMLVFIAIGIVKLPKIELDSTLLVAAEIDVIFTNHSQLNDILVEAERTNDPLGIDKAMDFVKNKHLPDIEKAEIKIKSLTYNTEKDQYSYAKSLEVCSHLRKNISYLYSYLKLAESNPQKAEVYKKFAKKYDTKVAASLTEFYQFMNQAYGTQGQRNIAQQE